MRRVMVRYRVKPDRVAENERLIAALYEQLRREQPAGLRYATFKAADGVSFTHLASIETADGGNPLTALSAFKAFAATVGERCDEPPTTTEIGVVGSYRFFDA